MALISSPTSSLLAGVVDVVLVDPFAVRFVDSVQRLVQQSDDRIEDVLLRVEFRRLRPFDVPCLGIGDVSVEHRRLPDGVGQQNLALGYGVAVVFARGEFDGFEQVVPAARIGGHPAVSGGVGADVVHVGADEPVVGVGGHLCGVDDREPLVAADALAAVIDRGVVEQVTRFGLGRRQFVRVDVEPVAAGV